jgi:hypothetical protein
MGCPLRVAGRAPQPSIFIFPCDVRSRIRSAYRIPSNYCDQLGPCVRYRYLALVYYGSTRPLSPSSVQRKKEKASRRSRGKPYVSREVRLIEKWKAEKVTLNRLVPETLMVAQPGKAPAVSQETGP